MLHLFQAAKTNHIIIGARVFADTPIENYAIPVDEHNVETHGRRAVQEKFEGAGSSLSIPLPSSTNISHDVVPSSQNRSFG